MGTRLVVLTARHRGNPAVHNVIETHPGTLFLWLDCQEIERDDVVWPNEAFIFSRNDELGFLAGVAAAHKTVVGHVGVVIGMDAPFMHPYHEGFEQGVAYVDPRIRVSHLYLSRVGDGFLSETLGGLAARVLLEEGADVVFHAAGRSGVGVFETIHTASVRTGRSLWAIGVDVDEHAKFEAWKSEPWASEVPLAGWQACTLTSIVKRLDLVAFKGVDNFLTRGDVGGLAISIENGGIDYVTSGGYIDDLVQLLEAGKDDLRNGKLQLVLNGFDRVRHLRDVLSP